MPSPTGHSPARFDDLSGSGADTAGVVLSGYHWGTIGSGVSLTYSFPYVGGATAFWDTSPNNYTFNGTSVFQNGTEPNREFRFALNTTQQAAVRDALTRWSDVANVVFTQSPDNSSVVGDLRFAFTKVKPGEGGHAYYPYPNAAAGDVWLSGEYASTSLATMSKGTYGFQTLLHEIGHALGIKHPFEGSPQLAPANDWMALTVMSYNLWNRAEDPNHTVTANFYPTTPMWWDIAAAQYLYGPNMSFRTGNDVYAFSENQMYWQTIWDAGGTDTIRYDGLAPAKIDLRTGKWMDLGRSIEFSNHHVLLESVTIYTGAVIENAIGGSGNDSIIGNDVNNNLNGRGGADVVQGLGGDDILVLHPDGVGGAADVVTNDGSPGAPGNAQAASFAGRNFSLDRFDGGAGQDRLTATESADVVVLDTGGSAAMIAGIEVIDARGGNDVVDLTSKRFAYAATGILGGAGNDVLWGNAGDDTLDGGAGNDQLNGGAGHDTLSVGSGADAAVGGAGIDLLVLLGARPDYALTVNANGSILFATTGTDRASALGIEQVQFGTAAPIAIQLLVGTVGTQANDVLHGTPGDDIAHGLGGNDTLTGEDGNDDLGGGAGNDTLDGGSGVDRLSGGSGNDTYVVDNAGDEVMEAPNQGIDLVQTVLTAYKLDANVEQVLYTGAGAFGGAGNALSNKLIGGAGADTLDGGAGVDRLEGGAGDDTYIVDRGTTSVANPDGTITALPGDTVVDIEGAADAVRSWVTYTLGASIENLVLTGDRNINGTGNGGNNALTGNSAHNVLNGSGGDDTFFTSGGNDRFVGGAGADTLNLSQFAFTQKGVAGGFGVTRPNTSTLIISTEMQTFTVTGAWSAASGDRGVESYVFSDQTVTLDVLIAGTASAFADQLPGTPDADLLVGGAGNDTYVVDHAADQVLEVLNQGTDLVKTTLAAYTLGANVEQLQFTGAGHFSGTGNAQSNKLVGGAGDDTLDGGTGADRMEGGAGNDTYVVDRVTTSVTNADGTIATAPGDVAFEGTALLDNGGNDTVRSSMTYTLGVNLENLVLIGSANRNGIGNGLNNSLTGNSGNNVLSGGAGDDAFFSSGGNDRFVGGAGNDTLDLSFLTFAQKGSVAGFGVTRPDASTVRVTDFATGQSFTVTGAWGSTTADRGIENYVFAGNTAITLDALIADAARAIADTYVGSAGDDRYDGLGGNDLIAGRAGSDRLTGGAGADAFIFDTALDALTNVDTITDFTSRTDRIRLDVDAFQGLALGPLSAGALRAGAGVTQAQDADDRLVYNSTTGALYFDADGAGGTDAVQFAILGVTAHPALTAADFAVM